MWLKVNHLNSIKRSFMQFPHVVLSPSHMASLLLLLLLHSFGFICMVSKLFARVICAALIFVFAIVGSLAGAIIGALIGLFTETGLLRGSGIGAISGAVFSIEVVESSLDVWNSRDCGSWSFLYLMNAFSLPFMESLDLYETGGSTNGMSMDEVEKLPKSKVTARGSLDESGERISCSVCLQDLQEGEMVRNLPVCCHTFHLPCIDSWLIGHGSCPLCRREVV